MSGPYNWEDDPDQLDSYVGWVLRSVRDGVVAGVRFTLIVVAFVLVIVVTLACVILAFHYLASRVRDGG